MIKMISGVYGMPVKHTDGRITVERVGPEYGPFSLSPEQEKRLVDRGVAAYVQEPTPEPAQVTSEPETGAEVYEESQDPIGFDEVPEPDAVADEIASLERLNAKALREMCVKYGISVKGNASKAAMIEAISAVLSAEPEDDDEPAPDFDASEAVL